MHDLDAYIAKLKATPELADLLAPLFELVQWQQHRIEELEAHVKVLQGRLDQNSINSHKPPASDLYKKAVPAYRA